MKIIIFSIKSLIAFFMGCIVFNMLKTRDTSRLQAITIKKRGLVNKIFSPKQLGDIEVSFKKLNIPYSTISVLSLFGIGGIISIIIFFICEIIFPLTSISLIVSIPFILSPFWGIKYVADIEQTKLEAGLNDFFIQLKSALKVNSDIVEALRKVQNTALDPFSMYIKQLLTEINAGKLPEKALESFAQKVNIKKFSLYINNVRYCHMYGGDIITLTEKTQNTVSEAIKQKKKREKETKSICRVFYLLVVIDIYMYFSFIAGNEYYLDMMVNSLIGNLILNINFLSIWGIIWLSKTVKKLDY